MKLSLLNFLPKIVVLDNFLTSTESGFLIELARPKIKRSQVVDLDTGENVVDSIRTSSDMYFDEELDTFSSFFDQLFTRLEQISGVTRDHFESPSVIKYEPGEFYEAHCDSYVTDEPDRRRVGTFIIYLNDVDKGGETEFTTIGLKLFPQVGRLLYFEYTSDNKEDVDLTFHKGSPPADGEKWVMSIWVKREPYKS